MNRLTALVHAIDHGHVPDATRRRLLATTTGLMGAAGLVAASVPFVESLKPSAAALAWTRS